MATVDTHAETFTPAERAYIRRELNRYFTTLPTVAEGLMLRTWKTGPRAGQAKLGPHIRVELGIDPPAQAKAAE